MTAEHERAIELLPWYVNATLNTQETALVEQHLGTCLACRQELARCRDLSVAVSSADAGHEHDWAPSPAHFAQVLTKLEASERGREHRQPAFLQRLLSWMRDTPRPVRFAFAFQGVAVLALAGALLLRAPPRVYETLSRPEQSVPSHRARLHVVFAPDIKESGLRQLLQSIRGVIVDGPSPVGVYTIELDFPASEHERVDQITARVAAHPQVRFATPVAR